MRRALRTLRRGSIAAAGLVLALSLPARGQESVVQLVPATSNVVESQHTVGVAEFSTEVRLRNTSTDPATGLRTLSTNGHFVRQSDGRSVTATWTPLRAGADPMQLRPGEEAKFQLSGNLPEPGIYETWIDSDPPRADDPSSEQRIRVVVTRTADTLPSDFIAELRPVSHDLSAWVTLLWPLGAREAPSDVLLSLRNATPQPLEFAAPVVVSYSKQSGDAVTAVATSAPPHIEAGGCASPLLPGKPCAAMLRLAEDAWAGQYLVDVGVGGAGGGWSERTQVVNVRASWLLAFLTIAAGVICGAFVNAWRATGRQSISGLIDVARLRESLLRLRPDPGDAESERLVASALQYADGIESAVRKGGDPAEGLKLLNANLAHLSAMVEVGRGLARLSPAGQSELRASWDALVGKVAIAAPADAKADLDANVSALASDVRDWPKLEAASTAAQTLADAITEVQTASGGQANADEATALVESLKQATEQARRGGTPAERILMRIETLETATRDARTSAVAYFNDAAGKLQTAAQALVAAAPAGSTELTRSQELSQKAAALVAAPPPADAVEAQLGDLAAQWKIHGELDLIINAAQPLAMTAGAAAPTFEVPGVPGLDVPVNVLLPTRGASLVQLERAQWRNELLTNGLILLATSLAGVVALWAQDPNWGSTMDIIAAFLAGAAVNVAIGPTPAG